MVAALDDGAGTTGVAPAATIVSYRVDGAGGIPISYLHRARPGSPPTPTSTWST